MSIFEKAVKEEARRRARAMVNETEGDMIPQFKAFVNTGLRFRERVALCWRILWRRF